MKIIIFRNYTDGVTHTPNAINAAAPDGAPPRRINDGNVLKRSCPAVPQRGPEAGDHRNSMDFHALGVNSRSCAFLQNRFFNSLIRNGCVKF